VDVLVPDADLAAIHYQDGPLPQRADGFWTRVWPSAIALCDYLEKYPELIKYKLVWEIAAGLALPSLYSAQLAKRVYSTDYSEDAVSNIEASILLNGFSNMEAKVWDIMDGSPPWQHDILLVSDINYDKDLHPVLLDLLMNELQKGISVLLATPDRLAGRDFLNLLMPFCIQQDTEQFDADGNRIGVFLFRLIRD
jgi:predicted nicotinamide N-methyase